MTLNPRSSTKATIMLQWLQSNPRAQPKAVIQALKVFGAASHTLSTLTDDPVGVITFEDQSKLSINSHPALARAFPRGDSNEQTSTQTNTKTPLEAPSTGRTPQDEGGAS